MYQDQPNQFTQPPQLGPEDEFNGIKRLITAAQICAIVSLLFGGLLLSIVSLALALIARGKASRLLEQASANQDAYHQTWTLLKRSASIAIVIAAVACVLNTITFIRVYPIIMQMLQTGDIGTLFGSGAITTTPAPNSSGSIWG